MLWLQWRRVVLGLCAVGLVAVAVFGEVVRLGGPWGDCLRSAVVGRVLTPAPGGWEGTSRPAADEWPAGPETVGAGGSGRGPAWGAGPAGGEAAATPWQGRVVLARLGLDAPLLPMAEAGGAIDPPGYRAVYGVANRGTDPAHAAEGTVYLAAHAQCCGLWAPGNQLNDAATGTPRVVAGDRLAVAGVDYMVTEVRIVPKAAIGDEADLWWSQPGRVVLITCLVGPNWRDSESNLVVIGELARP
jgi:hypothetical protein